jgi:hypothetical protein
VAWHPTNASLLASASADGSLVGFRPDGTKAFAIKLGSSLSGCAFSALQPDLMAAVGEAGLVQVWDVRRPEQQVLVASLKGHT